MEFNEVIRKRRSIRKFKPEPVPDEVIMELIEASRLALSGVNIQPWRYMIVKDKAMIEKLSGAISSVFVKEAPAVIVCTSDMTSFNTVQSRLKELEASGAIKSSLLNSNRTDNVEPKGFDEQWVRSNLALNTGISVTHLILKAVDLGLGSCWIGAFDEEKIKTMLNLEDRYNIVCLVVLGYPDENPGPRPRLPLEDLIIGKI